MKKSKVLTGLITALAFTTQALAAPATKLTKEQLLEQDSAMAVFLSINSTAPTEKAMQALLAPEDFKEIKAFLEKKKIDVSKLQMNDTPFFGGTLFYGNKTAEFQKDSSIRIDGHFYRYDKKLSPAQNYIRLFNAFSGKHETDKAMMLKKALLPEAAAAEGAPAPEALLKYVSPADKAGAAYEKMSPLERFRLSPSGRAPLNLANSTAESAGAKVGKSFFGRPLERGRNLLSGLKEVAKKGAQRVGGAYLPAQLGFSTLLLWGAGLAGAAYTANQLYGWYWHGVLSCKPADPQTGRSEYQFSFTNPNSSWYWRSTDTRDVTPEELADFLGNGTETYDQCMARSANSREACDQSVRDQKTLGQNCTKEFANEFTRNIGSSEEQIARLRDAKSGEGGASAGANK